MTTETHQVVNVGGKRRKLKYDIGLLKMFDGLRSVQNIKMLHITFTNGLQVTPQV